MDGQEEAWEEGRGGSMGGSLRSGAREFGSRVQLMSVVRNAAGRMFRKCRLGV